MRTWGRIVNADGSKTWVEVTTDDAGYNDAMWLTTLIQTLKLNLGESPFFANFGIPAQQCVVTQVFPDFYIAQTQQQFAPYFASLTIAKQASPTPTYSINAVTQQGSKINLSLPIPE